MCPNSLLPSKVDMSLDTFKSIIEQIAPYALTIKLSYIGEPLLNKDIISMILYAKASTRAKIVMFSNGTQLTHRLAGELVHSGLDEIVFSIDGFSAETYQHVRGKPRKDTVWRNVQDFLLFKGNRKPRVAINCVKLRCNDGERVQLRNFWESLGSSVMFSPFVNWSGQIDISGLSSETKHSIADATSRVPCAELWYKCVINAIGDVILCCNDYRALHNLGNILQGDISTIWNGSTLKGLRAAHIAGDFNRSELCKACYDWSDNEEMEGMLPGGDLKALRP